MTEYTDIKNRKYKVIQSIKNGEKFKNDTEFHDAAEREIVEALFRILKPKTETK